MKKMIALLLATVMCLSLVACGESDSDTITTDSKTQENDVLDKNDTDNYIGVWETEHMRLTINKGGVGEHQILTEGKGAYALEWEVIDEVLVTRISFMGMESKGVFELNKDGSQLSMIQNGFHDYVVDETEFIKQP